MHPNQVNAAELSSPTQGTPWGTRRIGVAGLCIVAALLGGLYWNASGQNRAISSLPQVERAELYQRTRANVERVCVSARDPGLDEFCQEQAELLRKFPECDGACVLLVDAILPKGNR